MFQLQTKTTQKYHVKLLIKSRALIQHTVTDRALIYGWVYQNAKLFVFLVGIESVNMKIFDDKIEVINYKISLGYVPQVILEDGRGSKLFSFPSCWVRPHECMRNN